MDPETKALLRATRGYGLLEPLLARIRARQANRLIPGDLRSGRILDIGCGSMPYFLAHTSFKEKYAMDQVDVASVPPDINFHAIDLNTVHHLPFADDYFTVVTMLAVVEHLDPEALVDIFRESCRVLIPNGILILTTPAGWTDRLLQGLASIGLVSEEEINEHVFAYTLPLLGWYFGVAGFPMKACRFGYFELGVNMWATARKA